MADEKQGLKEMLDPLSITFGNMYVINLNVQWFRNAEGTIVNEVTVTA